MYHSPQLTVNGMLGLSATTTLLQLEGVDVVDRHVQEERAGGPLEQLSVRLGERGADLAVHLLPVVVEDAVHGVTELLIPVEQVLHLHFHSFRREFRDHVVYVEVFLAVGFGQQFPLDDQVGGDVIQVDGALAGAPDWKQEHPAVDGVRALGQHGWRYSCGLQDQVVVVELDFGDRHVVQDLCGGHVGEGEVHVDGPRALRDAQLVDDERVEPVHAELGQPALELGQGVRDREPKALVGVRVRAGAPLDVGG